MHSIQSINIYSSFKKAIRGVACVSAITAFALNKIGLTSPSDPFHAIVQYSEAAIFGTAMLTLIVDLYISSEKPSRSRPMKEEIHDMDSLSRLPEEIILKILSHLTVTELAKCGEVSRRWRRLTSDEKLWDAFDLKKISPLLKVFDESDWVTHVDLSSFGLDVTDAPPIDKHQAIPVLKMCLSSLQIEEDVGITLLTVPKGLSFNKLVKLTILTKVGDTPKFKFSNSILSEIGDIPVDKTYRIIATNGVINGSRDLSEEDQKFLLSEIGLKMPKTIEAALLSFVICMRDGERLFKDDPVTYTRSSGQVDGRQLAVGGLSLNGEISVTDFYNFACQHCGVAGVLRKLQVLNPEHYQNFI